MSQENVDALRASIEATVLARFKNGRMTEFTDFGDKAKALEAAGLRE